MLQKAASVLATAKGSENDIFKTHEFGWRGEVKKIF